MNSNIVWSGPRFETPAPAEKGSKSLLDSSSDSDDKVESSGNRIYFYSEVTRTKNLEFNKSIKAIDIALQTKALQLDLDPNPFKIYAHISSYGGSVFAGFSSVDYIKTSKTPVVSVIDGCAASAATIMSVVASHRQMHKNAYMLIHQLSSGFWGKYDEIKDEVENMDNLMKTIKDIYIEHTKIPSKDLDKILKHDFWWDAKKCLTYGLIDEII
jgi:ATP-dependent protease ClpP protease subunit